MSRKRGAQPGNNNAYKHGFYSETFRQIENYQLSYNVKGNFEDEIAVLRVLIKRAMDKMAQESNVTLEENLSALRTVSFAAAVLERLHRSKPVGYDELIGMERDE